MRETMQHQRALAVLDETIERARGLKDPELALRLFTTAAMEHLGDKEMYLREGSLRAGEANVAVAGAFIVTPSRQHLILFADAGFPAAQRHLRLSIEDSRPGHTVKTGVATVLANTDHDAMFRQILSTARMGSAMYAPMFWQGRTIGMFNTACQARNTYSDEDLKLQKVFAAAGTRFWCEYGGMDLVAAVDERKNP